MKINKKFLILLMVINIATTILYLSNFEVEATTITEMETQASSFISKGSSEATGLNDVVGSITKNFTGLGQFLTMIGAGVMVAVVSYMGIKYIVSPPDKQGALKQQLIGVVVAGIVIFGAYGIWKTVLTIVSNL